MLAHMLFQSFALSAYAAKLHNLSCYIVSPKRGSELKRQIAESYGATVSLYNSTFAERDALIEQVRNETGAEYIMSSAQESTLCGQGTCGLEILEQVPEVDAVIVPCGGGGLLGYICQKISLIPTPLRKSDGNDQIMQRKNC